jgi:hypothetical protein
VSLPHKRNTSKIKIKTGLNLFVNEDRPMIVLVAGHMVYAKPVHVGFVVDDVALGQVSLQLLYFPLFV